MASDATPDPLAEFADGPLLDGLLLDAETLAPATLEALAAEAARTEVPADAPPASLMARLFASGARIIGAPIAGLQRFMLSAADAAHAAEAWLGEVWQARRRALLGAYLGDDDTTSEAFDHSSEPAALLATAAYASGLTVVEKAGQDEPRAFVTGDVELRDPALCARVAEGWVVLELNSGGKPLWLPPIGICGRDRIAVEVPIGAARGQRPVPVDRHIRLRFVPHDSAMDVLAPMADSVTRRYTSWCRTCGLEPDDLRNEILAKALAQPGSWLGQPDSYAHEYAYTVVRNAAVKYLRREGKRRLRMVEEGAVAMDARARIELTQALDEDSLERLRTALGKLRESYRVVLELSLEDWSSERIRAHLGLPTANSVDQIRRRAKQRLTVLLAGIEGDG